MSSTKVLLLYEGRQIFFGHTGAARDYFINLGFECAPRQNNARFPHVDDGLIERTARPGCETRVPRTPDEFATCWIQSQEYEALQAEIEEYKQAHPLDGPDAASFRAHKQSTQAEGQRLQSPYLLSTASKSPYVSGEGGDG